MGKTSPPGFSRVGSSQEVNRIGTDLSNPLPVHPGDRGGSRVVGGFKLLVVSLLGNGNPWCQGVGRGASRVVLPVHKHHIL